METFYLVYKTTNIINNKIYIGVQTSKKLDDIYYLGSGKLLKRAVKKYGRKSFKKEVMHVFDNIESAYLKEEEIVNDSFVARRDTYNVTKGGRGGHKGWKHSTKSKLKISKSNIGKKMSKEAIEKRAQSRRGKPSPNKGKKDSFEVKKRKSIAAQNRNQTLECPHCRAICDNANAAKWHFDNCSVVKERILPKAECPFCKKQGQFIAMKRWHFENCKFK